MPIRRRGKTAVRRTAAGRARARRGVAPVTITRPGHLGRMKFARRNMRIERRVPGDARMKYVSVLTPPLLVCAAFLFGVGWFLRREMGLGRSGSKDARSEDFPDDDPIAAHDADTGTEPSGTAERPDDD